MVEYLGDKLRLRANMGILVFRQDLKLKDYSIVCLQKIRNFFLVWLVFSSLSAICSWITTREVFSLKLANSSLMFTSFPIPPPPPPPKQVSKTKNRKNKK